MCENAFGVGKGVRHQLKQTEMTFNEHKIELIKKVENTPEYKNDIALQRVVEILKSIDSVKMLKKEKELIDRICVDSVENWETIEYILSFTVNYA